MAETTMEPCWKGGKVFPYQMFLSKLRFHNPRKGEKQSWEPWARRFLQSSAEINRTCPQVRHAHSQQHWGMTKTWTIHAYDSALRSMNLLLFIEVVHWEQFELTHIYLNLRQCLLTGFFGAAALDSKDVHKMWSWSCTRGRTQHVTLLTGSLENRADKYAGPGDHEGMSATSCAEPEAFAMAQAVTSLSWRWCCTEPWAVRAA